jgi:membrane protease YdiL (CAAX protease family)
MIRMKDGLRGFGLTVVSVWVVLCAAGLIYAQSLSIPASVALAVIPAFLVEAAFYLAAGFEPVRRRVESCCSPRLLALCLSGSAVLPYCVYALPAGNFRWDSFLLLAGLAAAATFWYVLLPRTAVSDLAFLALLAAVILAKVFSGVYVDPDPRIPMAILGQLMWIRLGIVVILSIRRQEGIGLGFVPRKAEWVIGIRHYLYFLPVGLPLALGTGLVRFELPQMEWWQALALAAGTFLGMLWVVALSEEFFFRGLLQQWLSRWLSNQTVGVLIASILFGLAHLPFRSFPNWRFAVVAAVAGCFYGRAYVRAGGIRAAMVAHALVNTTWRILFS